ncbi:hypothetical protein [Streptomyces sp. KMM 9044]|uniref:hypothetical protein n=1 Tax=Streptomyces sp. KMM 9044 TaxID=2744474 RepID=UPI002150B8FD|nr:hypothetical protein [Streptomyces sp. KMM 9044]WAX81636.1 hypothetical protein HUV60_032500 [Streptomyces sp. KMM 9044]
MALSRQEPSVARPGRGVTGFLPDQAGVPGIAGFRPRATPGGGWPSTTSTCARPGYDDMFVDEVRLVVDGHGTHKDVYSPEGTLARDAGRLCPCRAGGPAGSRGGYRPQAAQGVR